MEQYTKKFGELLDRRLIIVDVQEPFSENFPPDYINKLNKLSNKMNAVYQIWDANNDGKPDYTFPKEQIKIMKKYGTKPEKVELTPESQSLFDTDVGKQNHFDEEYGKAYPTTDGGELLYIGMGGSGPGHEWFKIPPELVKLLQQLQQTNAKVYIAGGANKECLYDIESSLYHYKISHSLLPDFVYSA